MMRLSRLTYLGLIFLGTTLPLAAQEPIRFARHPDISPDGKTVAFSYLGDIWTVEAIGGVARPVTMHQAHDAYPVFSPDGRWIAFSSNRHGSYDVFVVAAHGGRPRRLTSDSSSDIVNAWTPDGKAILFTSTRSTEFPARQELYLVPVEGGKTERVTFDEGRDGAFSPSGDRLVYARGPGTWYRKGYRGASNDDLWVCQANGSNNRRLTIFAGQDTSPMWSCNGTSLFYVSEFHGTPANIVRQEVEGSSPPQLMTYHKDEAVRRAKLSGNGEWIVYECGPDLWVASTREGIPARRLAIEAHADDKANADESRTFTSGASEYVLSPDEKHVAFVVHGSLFLMPIEGGKARRLTDTPSSDHGLAWAPDGQRIAFVSDRNRHDDVYLVEANDPEHPKFTEAHKFQVKRLTDTSDPESSLVFTLDGKRIAYLRAGQLWTMALDGTDQKVLVSERQVIDYDYSPDGKWLAYSRLDGSFASELYIMPATGGETKNVSRYATFNAGITWSRDGKKVAYVSQRPRTPTMHVTTLQKPVVGGATAGPELDLEDAYLRTEQPAPIPTEEGVISPDGTKVAFRSTGGADDLWVASVGGGQLTRVTTGNLRPTGIHWSKRTPSVIYFRDGRGSIRQARLGLGGLEALLGGSQGRPGGNDPATVPFTVKMTVKREEEYTEMFDQSWRALAEQFYDARFHGADWYAVRGRYRPLVKHIAMKEDLYALIHLMIGELNASHLGISGFGPTPEEWTADLGLVFDETHRGPGLKIANIMPRGPADRRGLNLRPGEYIWSIDGVRLTERTEVSSLLNSKAGETVVLQIAPHGTADSRDPKAFRRVEIQAVSRDVMSRLAYERWVDTNARRVAELSKDTLGYIHIPSMDEEGLDRFVRALYSDNYHKEAIVLDVRYNGGGFTHDQVLNYLGAREHTLFRQRYGGEGPVLRSYDRKWTKPLALLINNRSYSDAEIFPSAFKTLGLGRIVGQATGGHVIGTGSIRLIDGSLFRIPRIGVYTLRGDNMDRVGVVPDVPVETHPDEVMRGVDAQLIKAVEILKQDVALRKRNGTGVASKPEDPKAPVTPAPAVPGAPSGR